MPRLWLDFDWPPMPDFDQLRQEGDDAWLDLQRDNREPLKAFFRHLVDAIEAVSAEKVEQAVRSGIVLPRGDA